MPLLALMLLVPTVMPSVALAAGDSLETTIKMEVGNNGINPQDSTASVTTEEKLNNGVKLKFTPDKNWAKDISDKHSLILKAFEDLKKIGIIASIDPDALNDNFPVACPLHVPDEVCLTEGYLKTLKDSRNPLKIEIKSDSTYKLSQNQSYSINFSPALIEDWPGQVKSNNLEVYAKPQLSLGGSIISNTTLENIQKGGKVIELKLVNAKWKKANIELIEHYNKLLRSFRYKDIKANPVYTKWDVAESLINTDPNKVISFPNDYTLQLKLPANSEFAHQGTIAFEITDTNSTDLYTVDNVNQGPIGGDQIKESEKEFLIGSQGTPKLEVTQSIDEKDIIESSSSKIDLTLTNVDWSIGSNDEKKQLLIDSLSAKDQKDQWALIAKQLSTDSVTVTGKTVSIKLPQIENIRLSKDQVINVKLPYQLLENDVNMPEQQFTIKAQPKALLSGTATPSMSQTDYIKGGKTLTLTLVNAKWQNDVATNTTKRNHLLNSFSWNTTSKEQILARADVKRTNDSTVTVKLPPIQNDKVTEEIRRTKFYSKRLIITDGLPKNQKDELLSDTSNFLEDEAEFGVIQVSNQSAMISGTILDKSNYLDIKRGGKSVTITLNNDTWNNTVKDWDKNSNDAQVNIPLKVDGKPINYESLVRKNDNTITLTLAPMPSFELKKNSSLNLEVPTSLLNIKGGALPLKASPIEIQAVSASLSGTGVSMSAADVQKGGKTLILTLNNAEFSDLDTADFKKIFGETLSTPWNRIDKSNITISKNKMTIKLPAVPDFGTDAQSTIDLNLSSKLLKGYEDTDHSIDIDQKTVKIGETASASLGQGSSSFNEAAFKRGNSTISITLNDVNWDTSIETNTSKKSALLKGFTVSDQTKEWSLATKAIAKDGNFKVNGKTLTITLPSIADYSIVRNQVVDISIPKTVLTNYKYDIAIDQKITISIPPLENETSFTEMLDSGLADFVETNGIQNVRVAVPEKNVDKIATYVSDLKDRKVATVDVYTTSAAAKVTATLQSEDGEVSRTIDQNFNNLFTFVFDDMKDDTTLLVTVFNSDDEVIQEVYQKMAKGNKTYTVAPKTPLDGKYSLYSLLTQKSLLTNILKYYTLDELKIGSTNN